MKTKPMENKNWPDKVRLKMIEKSKFYVDEQVYQYGFYDGYQLCFEQCQKRDELIKAQDELIEYMEKDESGFANSMRVKIEQLKKEIQ
jgi:hypothetical protein